jgi:hypothetical protein
MTALPDFVQVADLEDYRAGDPDTLVRQAQATIRRYCGWHIAPNITETVTLDGNGGRNLSLPSLYVTDIDSITELGDLVDVADYDWSVDGRVHRRYCSWTTRPRQVIVEFEHGYDLIPDDLIQVAVSLANRRSSSPAGIRRETTGPFSVEYGIDFLQDERDVLNLYKLPPRP